MNVYIVVRNTEDFESNSIDVFQSVHASLEDAEINMKKLKEDFGTEDDEYEILERTI